MTAGTCQISTLPLHDLILGSVGSDMAIAFIAHVSGPELASKIRNMAEMVEVQVDDDPFAAIHGLV